MKQLSDCKDKESGLKKSFSKSESGITFKIQSINDFGCEVIDIDDCVLKEEAIRKCDWLFLVNDKKIFSKPKAYYIELKGINIDEACEQLFNAIDRTRTQIANFDIETRVVGKRGAQPEILNSEYYRKVKRITKKEITFCKAHKGNKFTHVETI